MALRPFPGGWNVKLTLIRGLQPFQKKLGPQIYSGELSLQQDTG